MPGKRRPGSPARLRRARQLPVEEAGRCALAKLLPLRHEGLLLAGRLTPSPPGRLRRRRRGESILNRGQQVGRLHVFRLADADVITGRRKAAGAD